MSGGTVPKGTFYIPAGQTTIIRACGSDAKENPKLMEEYLKPLNGRRFLERKHYNGKPIDMNIVIVNLTEENRKKILEKEGEEHEECEDYNQKLNGVEIEARDLSKGQPVGFENLNFKGWKLDKTSEKMMKRYS